MKSGKGLEAAAPLPVLVQSEGCDGGLGCLLPLRGQTYCAGCGSGITHAAVSKVQRKMGKTHGPLKPLDHSQNLPQCCRLIKKLK